MHRPFVITLSEIVEVECGVNVVYVSNHGGRQLDHGRGTMDVLLAAEVKRLREGDAPWPVLRSGTPSTTRPSLSKAERGRSPKAGGRQTRANAPGPREVRTTSETAWPVRLLLPARGRARRRRRGRRAPEPQPLEQDPQALAPRVHPHKPPPAAAAQTLEHVRGEHPAQQRRLRRPLRWRTPGPRRRLRERPRPLAGHRRRGSAPWNDLRPPRRGRTEHPMKAQRMKSTGRNQDRQLLDQLQRIQQQVGRAICSRMRQLEHHLPVRALSQPLQRQRRAQERVTS